MRIRRMIRQLAVVLPSFALVIAFGQSAGLAENGPTARAGWAEIEITPPLGIALGGRGGPTTLANKILDPLYAQVLYLKDGKGTGFVLVSFDIVGITHELGDRIRTAVVHETGAEWNLVVLNCSHTHSGPYMIRNLMAGVVEDHERVGSDADELWQTVRIEIGGRNLRSVFEHRGGGAPHLTAVASMDRDHRAL